MVIFGYIFLFKRINTSEQIKDARILTQRIHTSFKDQRSHKSFCYHTSTSRKL
jgi:hypothetical protein